jgi:hypothetical protein
LTLARTNAASKLLVTACDSVVKGLLKGEVAGDEITSGGNLEGCKRIVADQGGAIAVAGVSSDDGHHSLMASSADGRQGLGDHYGRRPQGAPGAIDRVLERKGIEFKGIEFIEGGVRLVRKPSRLILPP